MNKKSGLILISVIIVLVLIGSISFKWNKKEAKSSVSEEVSLQVEIEDKTLDVTFLEGNKLNDKLTYGNKTSRTIKIENKNDEPVVYALSLSEMMFTNDLVTYKLYGSKDNHKFDEIIDYSKIDKNNYLAYNLAVSEKSVIYLKVEFKANLEGKDTRVKGKLNIISNLSEREKILLSISKMMFNLDDKVNALNGISEKGIYMIDASELTEEYKGYVLIDATDVANIKNMLFIYNNDYMINNVNYATIKKSNIVEKTNEDFSKEGICKNYSKEECKDFMSLSYNKEGGKKQFSMDSKDVFNSIKEGFKQTEKRVYVYDIKGVKDLIRGYILINNTAKETEYYLYITNDTFMVTGYNITKLGDYDEESPTIRSYVESTFNVSSKDMKTVCEFSGFKECYDQNNNLIK